MTSKELISALRKQDINEKRIEEVNKILWDAEADDVKIFIHPYNISGIKITYTTNCNMIQKEILV